MFKNIVLLIIAGMFLGFGEAMSQTPDSETPALEEVCDDLRDATPGLYGLCVAFCEAQDLDDMIAIVEDGGMPGAKILERYNAKRREGDPDMPCLIAASQCPCFNFDLCESLFPLAFSCDIQVNNINEFFSGQSCSGTDLCDTTINPLFVDTFDVCLDTGNTTGRLAHVVAGNTGGVCFAELRPLTGSNVAALNAATAKICQDELDAYDGTTSGTVNMCGL